MKKDSKKSHFNDKTLISILKQTVEDLKKRNQFLEGVIENLPDIMFVKDIDSRHVLANNAYYKMAMAGLPNIRIKPKSKDDLL